MSKQLISCDIDEYSVTVAQAHKVIAENISPISEWTIMPLRQALNRVLARDILSSEQVPNHTNSAMDGYAFSSEVLGSEENVRLNVIGYSYAGKPFEGKMLKHDAVRIMTGAMLPEAADTVIMQERVEIHNNHITFTLGSVNALDNVRYAGEDIQIGQKVGLVGERITPALLGVLSSVGISEVPVFRKPIVAFFSNGNELCSVGEQIKKGYVRDSNRYTFFAMLSELDVDILDLGVVNDSVDDLTERLTLGAKTSDLILTSAGASVGDADYMKQVVDSLGMFYFSKVAVKPGRPFSFGRVFEKFFFGLPGNPVSVMVTFKLFVEPAIRMLSGLREKKQITITAKTITTINKKKGRVEYQRGILSKNASGEYEVKTLKEQGSGILSSVRNANCFVILSSDKTFVASGELVCVMPLSLECD